MMFSDLAGHNQQDKKKFNPIVLFIMHMWGNWLFL